MLRGIGRVRRPRVQPAANALANFRSEGGEIFAFEKAVGYSNTCRARGLQPPKSSRAEEPGAPRQRSTPRSHDAAHFSGLAAVT